MNYVEVRQKVLSSIRDWKFIFDDRSPEKLKKYNTYHKIKSCGEERTGKYGKSYWKACKSVGCPRCSRKFGSRQASKLLECHPDAVKEDYRSITFILGWTKNPEEIYPMFKKWRSGIKREVFNRRRRVGAKALLWKNFAIASILEIDMFREDQYNLLGDRKQKQLKQKLNYTHKANSNDNVFVIHVHSIAHIGRLEESDFAVVAAQHSSDVDIRPLYDNRTLNRSTFKMMKYSAKVPISRELPDGKYLYYDKEQIGQYMSAAYKVNRKSYMCFIGSVGNKSKMKKQKTEKIEEIIVEKDGCLSELGSVQKRVYIIDEDKWTPNRTNLDNLFEQNMIEGVI